MSTESSYAVTLFYCYACEDEWLLKQLEKHIVPLKRQGYLNGWYDRQIEAGMEWKQEIELHLSAAILNLILLSPDFLHSDARDEDMHRARIAPLWSRAGDFTSATLNSLGRHSAGCSRTPTRQWSTHHDLVQPGPDVSPDRISKLATLSGSNSTFLLSR